MCKKGLHKSHLVRKEKCKKLIKIQRMFSSEKVSRSREHPPKGDPKGRLIILPAPKKECPPRSWFSLLGSTHLSPVSTALRRSRRAKVKGKELRVDNQSLHNMSSDVLPYLFLKLLMCIYVAEFGRDGGGGWYCWKDQLGLWEELDFCLSKVRGSNNYTFTELGLIGFFFF